MTFALTGAKMQDRRRNATIVAPPASNHCLTRWNHEWSVALTFPAPNSSHRDREHDVFPVATRPAGLIDAYGSGGPTLMR
jgi:hypothetical protein